MAFAIQERNEIMSDFLSPKMINLITNVDHTLNGGLSVKKRNYNKKMCQIVNSFKQRRFQN